MPPKRSAKTQMTDSHKAALAEGREQGRAVRRYLEALQDTKPKRGRRRTQESIQRRLAAINERYDSVDPLSRLHLAQERMDLAREATTVGASVDLPALEAAFVAAAGPYSRRKGLTYGAWREAGVPPVVLQKANIPRS